jgi:circadian clock protein KaiC
LDNVLHGGFPAGHLYLVEGEPGTGKTTLALQFLLAGVRQSESTLYVTLSETSSELLEVIEGHGWDPEGIEMVQLDREVASHSPERQYTVFEATDVELGDMLKAIYDATDRFKPTRVVLDSVSELRLLARDSLRFRRELLGLKQHFADLGTTLLVLDDRTLSLHEGLIHSIAHGVVRLERMAVEHGSERRRLIVPKVRGSRFREGFHDYRIETGGIRVYPRLVAADHRQSSDSDDITSGLPNLDELLGGGIARGTSTILLGPSGAGKSTLSVAYAVAAASIGERVEIYLFDENLGTYLKRAHVLGLGLQPHLDSGMIAVRQIDPAEISPGEFAHRIRHSVEELEARHLIIDSLNGIVQAMPGEKTLLAQMHELLSFLNQKSVTTIMTLAQHGVVGSEMASDADLSYLADSLVMLRYFEAFGELRRAISVVKKRTGPHEMTVREMKIGGGGISVGDPLREFQGVFTGVPQYVGTEAPLFHGSR